ncbi:hypothetical protein A6A40_23095 (plasmid) [Azospirillum humicireducens]|uniref:Uncharacterized protein n=1 Tax=Azospirillum humicireducens TaxID=1226968 RepID=A0A2R4VU17_9PROT|nr:hypothetical protein A6A40_23095 [Azospirillum humicireducens]
MPAIACYWIVNFTLPEQVGEGCWLTTTLLQVQEPTPSFVEKLVKVPQSGPFLTCCPGRDHEKLQDFPPPDTVKTPLSG